MNGIVLLCLAFEIVFLFSYLSSGISGAISLLMLSIIGNMALPLTSVFINTHSPEHSRATALSVIAFLSKLPYAVVAIFMGIIINKYSVDPIILVFGILCVVPAFWYFLFLGKSKKHTI